VFNSKIKYGCYFYLPRKFYERKYTVRAAHEWFNNTPPNEYRYVIMR